MRAILQKSIKILYSQLKNKNKYLVCALAVRAFLVPGL